ncbi:hypothetical protein Btru_039701, partial [Bulinus truncatus]
SPAIPAVYSLLTLTFCPESPKYLLVNKGNDDAAEAGQKMSITKGRSLFIQRTYKICWCALELEYGVFLDCNHEFRGHVPVKPVSTEVSSDNKVETS